MSLSVDSFVFDARPKYPLLVTAKRYRGGGDDACPSESNSNALTLVFAHGTGFHKEQWEPTIEELSSILADRGGIAVREFWSIDCPNHGDAGVLNEETLKWGYENVFSWTQYTHALQLLLSGQGTGLPTDFKSHNLVGIGHSMGAVSLIDSLMAPMPTPVWRSLILVEPMIVPPSDRTKAISDVLERGALTRRDIWASKDEAYNVLKERKRFKVWDPRVLRIFCEHGLRDLPSAVYPDKKEGVTLKCSKLQEAATYRDFLGISMAYRYLKVACTECPVHVIYGSIDDAIPAFMKDLVVNEVSMGRLASVRRVDGAGHLVVQTHPKELAQSIFAALDRDYGRQRTQSQHVLQTFSKL